MSPLWERTCKEQSLEQGTGFDHRLQELALLGEGLLRQDGAKLRQVGESPRGRGGHDALLAFRRREAIVGGFRPPPSLILDARDPRERGLSYCRSHSQILLLLLLLLLLEKKLIEEELLALVLGLVPLSDGPVEQLLEVNQLAITLPHLLLSKEPRGLELQ